jgi:hypothetical protein
MKKRDLQKHGFVVKGCITNEGSLVVASDVRSSCFPSRRLKADPMRAQVLSFSSFKVDGSGSPLGFDAVYVYGAVDPHNIHASGGYY